MFKKISNILRMIKFSHTIFAFPFAIVSFIMNYKVFPPWDKVVFIALAMIFARSSAMTFNRLVDVNYDSENARTQNRELVTGVLKKKEVLIFFIIMSIGFIGASYFINQLCFLLSPLVLGILLFYSYWKRFSYLTHFYLGMVIGLAPIGVDIALNEQISLNSILLFLSVMFWVAGFDIIYSLLDIDFDKKAKLHSLPSKLGTVKALWISRVCYGIMVLALVGLGWTNHLGWIYGFGLLGIAALLIVQHYWVRPDNFSKVNLAFFNLNSLISVAFVIIVILDIFLLNR